MLVVMQMRAEMQRFQVAALKQLQATTTELD